MPRIALFLKTLGYLLISLPSWVPLAALAAASAPATIAKLQAPRESEIGFPSFRIHSSTEIGTMQGSRFVAIDTNGRILFSSVGELSAFDGTQWRRVSAARRRSNEDITAVAAGPDGRIYVGGLGYWGRLEVDERGRYVIEFLATEEEQIRNSIEYFNDIVFCDSKVYFKGTNSLVEWSEATGSRSWKKPHLDLAFEHENRIFTSSSHGFQSLENGRFSTLAVSAMLEENNGSTMESVDWPDGRKALFHRKKGLLLFDGQDIEDIADDLEGAIPGSWANDLVHVSNELFAVTLNGKGLKFFNGEGKVILSIDQDLDYRFLECGQIAVAPDGSIWVTLVDGLAQIQSPYPVSFFDQRLQVPLNYFDRCRLGQDLLLRTNGKLYLAQYSENGNLEEFELYPAFGDQAVYELYQYGNDVLASLKTGVYRLSAHQEPTLVLAAENIYRIFRKNDTGKHHFIFSSPEELLIVEENAGAFNVKERVSIEGRPNRLFEDSKGDIWLERGVSKIGRAYENGDSYSYKEYGVESGLTSDQWISLWDYRDEARFTSRKGPLRFDRESERFVVDEETSQLIPKQIRQYTRPALSPKGDFWILAQDGNLILRKQADGTFLPDYETLAQLGPQRIDRIEFEAPDIVWLISKKSLIRIDDSQKPVPLSVSVPQFTSITDPQNAELYQHFAVPGSKLPKSLPYSRNNLQFQFNLPNYRSAQAVLYQHRLLGFSTNWSQASKSSTVTLNRIPSGNHTLEVRAIWNQNQTSPVATIPITIANPAYRSTAAYAGYFFGSGALILLILKIRHIKLLKRQKELEEKVVLQTKELREKNIQLRSAVLKERELKKKAEHANDVKSDFLAMVSHEIRTPMNCIIGMADQLLSTPLQAEQFDMLQSVYSSGQSLVAIISDILDFSKIEAGKIKLENAAYSPSQAVRDVFNLFLPSCDGKTIEIRSHISADVPELVVGDPIRLKQILINLVGNARKFTNEGHIEICLRLKSEQEQSYELEFFVEDTGIGINEEDMELLFKAFSQIDSSNTRRFGGTGLGLVISQRLVKLMNGEIGVSSEKGHGSKFLFTIHAGKPSEAELKDYQLSVPQRLHPTSTLPPSRGGQNQINLVSRQLADILIVDDNPINQQVTSMMLRRVGYSCDIVGRGEQALELLERKRYKAILMDIQMPEMDGYECTRRILEKLGTDAPPIIAVTAKSSDLDRTTARNAGMIGFLTKPLERSKLKEALAKVIAPAEPKA